MLWLIACGGLVAWNFAVALLAHGTWANLALILFAAAMAVLQCWILARRASIARHAYGKWRYLEGVRDGVAGMQAVVDVALKAELTTLEAHRNGRCGG